MQHEIWSRDSATRFCGSGCAKFAARRESALVNHIGFWTFQWRGHLRWRFLRSIFRHVCSLILSTIHAIWYVNQFGHRLPSGQHASLVIDKRTRFSQLCSRFYNPHIENIGRLVLATFRSHHSSPPLYLHPNPAIHLHQPPQDGSTGVSWPHGKCTYQSRDCSQSIGFGEDLRFHEGMSVHIRLHDLQRLAHGRWVWIYA